MSTSAMEKEGAFAGCVRAPSPSDVRLTASKNRRRRCSTSACASQAVRARDGGKEPGTREAGTKVVF